MTTPTTQKSIFHSKDFKYSIVDRPVPTPGEGELLIKVTATGLNPGDWKVQKFGITLAPEEPAVPGMDTAGVVEAVGAGAEKEFKKGDRVMYMGRWSVDTSSFQQYMIAAAEFVSKVPDNITDDEAATIPVCNLAAWTGLYNDAHGAGYTHPFASPPGDYTGKPLLVIGGSSSVGQYALQWAKLSKFSPVITTASPKHFDYLKSLGATHTLNRSLSPEETEKAIREITSEPIRTVFDTISSKETQDMGLSILAPGGKILLVDARLGEYTAVDDDGKGNGKRQEEVKKIVYVKGVNMEPAVREIGLILRNKLYDLVKDGVIKPNRPEVCPGGLSAIVPALDRVEAGTVSGVKLVVRPQEGL